MQESLQTSSLVLIHGYPFDHTLWDGVLQDLDPEVKVIAPDLRGFGGPEPGDQAPSLDVMADDIIAKMDSENIDKAFIVGMSMGGYVALAIADRHPHRLAGIVLVNSQATADSDAARKNRAAMIETVKNEGPGPAAEAIIGKLFGPSKSSDLVMQQYPRTAAQSAGRSGIVYSLEAMANRPDRTKVLQELGLPILILHSSEDQIVPVGNARTLAESLISCRYIEIQNAGHCAVLEAPSEVAKALNRFVNESVVG